MTKQSKSKTVKSEPTEEVKDSAGTDRYEVSESQSLADVCDNLIADLSKSIAEAYNWRGVAYRTKGEYDEAIDDFSEAVEINSNYAEAYEGRGRAYGMQEEYCSAIDDFSKAIELNPNYAEAYEGRGQAHQMEGEYDEAIADFSKAIDLNPSKAIEINPNYAEAYVGRGNDYHTEEEYDEAIADFSKAIEINPNYAEAYESRGWAYEKKEEYDSAMADFSKAIELDPDVSDHASDYVASYPEQYVRRGNDYSDYDSAMADFSKAIEINPNYAEAYAGRGWVYSMRYEYDKAIADYSKAIELDPDVSTPGFSNCFESFVELGTDCLEMEDDYDTAIAVFSKAIEINPNYGEAYESRGHAYYMKDEYDNAIEDMEAAIRLAKDQKRKADLQEIIDSWSASPTVPSHPEYTPPNRRDRIPTKLRQLIWERDDGQCAKCGSSYDIHFDHIIPVSKGGSTTEENLELLCSSCNLSKSAKIE